MNQFKMEVRFNESDNTAKLIFGDPSVRGGVVVEEYTEQTKETIGRLAVAKMQAAFGLDIGSDSSLIEKYNYDEAFEELTLTLRTGNTYRYMNFPAWRAAQLMHSTSKGAFFNRYIKGQFPVLKLA